MNFQNQLKHLVNSIPKDVITYQTSFYVVALEGWRRGLKLKFYNNRRGGSTPSTAITYSLSDGENEYHFVCARGTKTTKEAISKAENKSTAYEYMKANGVPVPETKTFKYSETSIEEMCDYAESIGYPVVVKPPNYGGGKGVITNIVSREKLQNSLLEVEKELGVKRIIIEKYFEGGYDYRFYVMGDEVLAVTINYPSNVLGDGQKNIKELIEERNIEIKNNVATKNRFITIDAEMKNHLKENNLSLESIPAKDERIFLRKHGTHLGTRLNTACTDSIDPKFKQYAVDALNSIPGLPTGSIDMIINEEKNEGIVNEINTKGEIMMHVIPLEGQAVDIPKYLMDYYFPGSRKINDHFYFEYKPVKELFLNGHADEITIPRYPHEDQYETTFNLKGKRLGPLYLKKLKRKAASLYLKGQIKSISREQVEIFLVGNKEKLKIFEDYIYNSETEKSKIHEVSSTDATKFENTISVEIEIMDNFSPKTRKQKTKSKDKNDKFNSKAYKERLLKKIEDQGKEIVDLTREIEDIRSSKSWRLTRPLRKINRKINRKK